MKSIVLLFSSLYLLCNCCFGLDLKVLFIGNSYTQRNNLPQKIANLAASNGDSLIYDTRLQGAATLQVHASNTGTYASIKGGKWDFVIIQAQSQEPAFSPVQVSNQTFPYAKQLSDSIKANDPCSEIIFYMTWGRENGDASNCGSYPPICTYLGMQQSLRESYLQMADDNDCMVSPVGMAWKEARALYPSISLYANDGSHPNQNGTYLAACVFYSSMFRKSSIGLSFPSQISADTAGFVQQISSATVLDSLELWGISKHDQSAMFTAHIDTAEVSFTNSSVNSDLYYWDFGDDDTSSLENPFHDYDSTGTYLVTLVASNNCSTDTFTKEIQISIPTVNDTQSTSIWSINEENDLIELYPIPANNTVFIELSKGQAMLEIYNLLGIRVKVLNIIDGKNVLSVAEFQSGVYHFVFRDDQDKVLLSRKLLIGK